jgi:hypothetical protein
MNFLGKWGKKLLIAGISSFVFEIIFKLMGVTLFDDLGGDYLNFALIALGGLGMYIDSTLRVDVENNKDEGLSPLMAQAILEEKKARKIEEWDNHKILAYLNQTLDSNRFSVWLKSREITIGNEPEIYLRLNFMEMNELISPTQEITLKDGKKYTQNKHELAIKKEYSEKVFLCANNLIEDLFEKIIKLTSLRIRIYFPENRCILEMQATREQFFSLKNSKTENILERLRFFNLIYDFDNKNFEFKEI